jgi:hypothetical protein
VSRNGQSPDRLDWRRESLEALSRETPRIEKLTRFEKDRDPTLVYEALEKVKAAKR